MMDFVIIVLGVMAGLSLWTALTFVLMSSKGFVKLLMKYYEKWFSKYVDVFEEEL